MKKRADITKSTIMDRFKSIRSAMLVSFSFLTIIALLIFLLIALNYTKKTVIDNSIAYTSRLIDQVNYDIDSYIAYMENISTLMVKNQDVQSYLFVTNQPRSLENDQRTRILSQFRTVLEGRKDISNIAAFAENGKTIVNNGTERSNQYIDVTKLNWYQAAIQSETGVALSSSHVQNAIWSSYEWVITLSRALIDQRTGVRSGVFFVDLNYSAISDLCSRNQIGKKGYIFILDDKGNIIYHPKQQLIYGGLKTENIDAILACKDDYLVMKEGNDSRLYTMSKSASTGWTVVGTSYVSELLKNSKQMQMQYLLVAAVLLVGAVALSSIITNSIIRPLEQLKDSMSKVEQGEFKGANIPITTNNEIGSLTRSFNVMTNHIEVLMEEIVYEQQEKRKSELKALQSQINPHFLYNTLDSIIWMAEGKQNDEVVLMTSALAKLLRKSISNDNELISIRQERDYIISYLTIQKMRYKDKLEYEVELEPEIENVQIIKLVLQPIVENAIYHGLKYKETKGHLIIEGRRIDEDVVIAIMDDGAGMSQDALDHIFDVHKVNYNANGVGVYNVQQRLQLYYGSKYGISYTSHEGEGTIATITIPFCQNTI